ncbi:MAG: glycosyltransferase family 2 protein [Gaiellaceae bacterium MAG52_C11]|nr:glycosyltransferase family 2 protein [Candidatus Gaiellasilicea maunaloa]
MEYAAITPVRNEADNLPRLAASMVAQSARPLTWLVVDNGSTDETPAFAAELEAANDWIRVLRVPGEAAAVRGAPIVRAFNAGLEAIGGELPDIVVKLDADVSFEPDHFERLLAAFAEDPSLGLAGSMCWEEQRGKWRPQFTTRSHVRGAVRCYRRACLEDVLPLEEGMGWDGIDELKAAVRGWRTATISDVPFLHHRSLGERERRLSKWTRQGEMAHYMGYRPSYLVLRALFRARRDPAAVAMVWGYAGSALARRPQYSDPVVREHLRLEQSLSRLRVRVREAIGRASTVDD